MKRLIRATEEIKDKLILYKSSNIDLSKVDLNVFQDYKEVGMHCGTLEQAITRKIHKGYKYINELKVSNYNFLQFNSDEQHWTPNIVSAMISIILKDNTLRNNLRAGALEYNTKLCRDWFIEHNYSGFCYPNTSEGPGLSYCICDLSIVDSVELVEAEDD